jgi:hypothetical protein
MSETRIAGRPDDLSGDGGVADLAKTRPVTRRMPAIETLGVGTVCLALVLGVPQLRELFHFDILHPLDWSLCVAAGMGSVLWFEIHKLIRKRSA